MELHNLTGKVAIVTGGSRGIGRAIAQALAEAGADVVIASRKLDACEEVAAQLRASTATKATAIACHVGKWEDCGALVDTTIEQMGRLDILVNNAGMSPLYPSIHEITEELYDKTLAVNLKGPFRLGRSQPPGWPITTAVPSSTSALPARRCRASTSCRTRAEGSLNLLTIGLANAYGPKVRVNAVLPGPFLTDISKGSAMEGDDVPYLPMRRLGRPEEAAPIVVHLASPAASFTTGAIIRVDGGVTRHV